jgi:hypothetical protein
MDEKRASGSRIDPLPLWTTGSSQVTARSRCSFAREAGGAASAVAKYLLAGADVVMTASALLRHGPEHATVLIDGLEDWMARKGFAAVDELRGMLAVPPGTDEGVYERAGYVGALREANSGTYGPW